jgi:hypothetical protein
MPHLTTIILLLTITLNVFLIIRIRQQDKEATRREKRKKKGVRKYLPLILLNITAAITLTINIKIEISNNQNNNQNSNVNANQNSNISTNQNSNVPGPRPSPSAQDGDQEAEKLKEKLRTTYEGDGFTVKPLLETELVKGRKCCYYELIIKGPALFPVGEYVIRDQDKEYSQPLTNFFDEVVAILRRAHIEHQLLIKGRADKTGDTTFSKNFEVERWTYREFPYLPYDRQQQQFTPDQETWRIRGPYTNKDLPNLRARYTQDTLKNSPRQLESTILAGEVTPRLREPKDRNITILLYIQWPQ